MLPVRVPPTVGDAAPLFALRSVQGQTVDLAAYRGRVNVVLWFKLCAFAVRTANNRRPGLFGIEPLVLLSGAYVFGCAFRSILPRADVPSARLDEMGREGRRV